MPDFAKQIPMVDGNDMFVNLGFCPYKVRITDLTSAAYDSLTFYPMVGNDSGLLFDQDGGTGNEFTTTTTAGISCVQITETFPHNLDSDPSVISDPTANWWQVNGIKIHSDVALLAAGDILLVEAWKLDNVCIKATHDGGDNCNTYFEDSSIDFKKAGVCAGWILVNHSNGNYAYVDKITQPVGESKACRIYLATSWPNGTSVAAGDFDDSDVCYLVKKDDVPYPLGDLTLMS